jgi:hypothetical protein
VSHKSTKRIKASIRKAKFDALELMSLLRFLMVLLQTTKGSKHLTKSQRKSLAITESQLGVRVGRGKHHSGAKKSHRRLSAGIHNVRVGKHMRRVRVLASGKWQFMKG